VNKIYTSRELKADKSKKFCDNEISTSKYNVFTFLPLNLFYQFTKFSNIYFLAMAMLQVYSNLP
jgi:hypothetical protein